MLYHQLLLEQEATLIKTSRASLCHLQNYILSMDQFWGHVGIEHSQKGFMTEQELCFEVTNCNGTFFYLIIYCFYYIDSHKLKGMVTK